tara:strand:- start:5026 stop:6834 length:1809 start_codon:yes stop_codon:yes gene_type:complete
MLCILQRGYKLQLCLTWGWQPVAFSLLVAYIVVLLVELEGTVGKCTLIGLLLIFTIVSGNSRAFAAAAMSGDWPCLLPIRDAPSNRQEMLDALEAPRVKSGKGEKDWLVQKSVSVVGSGFGYWSWRQGAPSSSERNRIYTHNLVGLATAEYAVDPAKYLVFYAGTTIHQASKLMEGLFVESGGGSRRERLKARAGRTPTFWSHPSISTISLGAWFACSGHGNGGPAGNPSSKGLCFVELYDMQDGKTLQFVDDKALEDHAIDRVQPKVPVYMEIRRRFDYSDGRYVIIALGFRKPTLPGTLKGIESGNTLAPNVIVGKQLCTIDMGAPPPAARANCVEWMEESAVLRVLFIGRALPKLALGIRWTEFDGSSKKWPKHKKVGTLCLVEEDHIDEHDCSKDARAAQADTCRLAGGCFETDPESWKGVSLLSEANIFSPLEFPPLLGVLIPSLGFYNFEVVCKPGSGKMGPDELYKLLTSLSTWHEGKWNPLQSGYGRTEIRCGSGGGDFVWVDFAVTSASFKDAFKITIESLRPKSIALHTGKYKSRQLELAFERAIHELTAPARLLSLSTPFDVFSDAAQTQGVGRALFGDLAARLPVEMQRV